MQSVSSPSPPNSPHILLSAAGNAANEKRNKTIMNCFRDRTPSYTRSNYYNQNQNPRQQQHHQLQQQQQRFYEQNSSGVGVGVGSGRPEAVVFLKELRSSPNKLALLKSSSTRDLSRLVDEVTIVNFNENFNGVGCMSTSSSSSSSNQKNVTHKSSCSKQINELEKRLTLMERDMQEQKDYTRNLETQVLELTKRLQEITEVKQVDKRKKLPSVRKNATNGNVSVQPSRFNAWLRLTNLWKHRPSIETLKEKNIYNDEPCFDTEIEMVLKHEIHKTIPKIVVDCCDIIYEKYRESSIPIEGIYRQCGDYNKIQTLRFRIDGNDYESLRQPNIDIHTLTGLLKLFLREIKSPLVSSNEAKTFIGKPNQWLLTDLPTKIEILKRLIRSLPEVNRDTMEYIFGHFNKLTKVPLQQISAETLSLSVTPSIFHTVQGAQTQDIQVLLKESEILADCVKIMIEYQSRIFECTADRRLRRLNVRSLRKTLSHPDLIFQNLF